MRAWLTPSHPRFELALAVLLAAAVLAELAIDGLLTSPLRVLLGIAIAAPVAIRMRHPLAAVTLSALAAAVETALPDDEGRAIMPVVCVLVVLYAVGSRCTGWRFWAGGAIAAGLFVASDIVREGVSSDLVLGVALPGVGLLIGRAAGALRLETDVLHERAATLERERDAHTRRALELERRRIARELHDVIGHSISVMGVQAGAVRSILPAERERERAALLGVERTGREAIAEMRRLIGLLRFGDDATGPQPSLVRVESLAAEMRATGLDLTLCVEGDVSGLPPGVDLAAYRIVQEALTNAMRHAPGARVDASVRVVGDVLEVDVADDGSPQPPAAGHVGHGLLGMRERAALYGGEIVAGPGADGGFRVHARLPVNGS